MIYALVYFHASNHEEFFLLCDLIYRGACILPMFNWSVMPLVMIMITAMIIVNNGYKS